MYTIYNKQLYRWSICFLPYYIELEMHKNAYSICIVNIRIPNMYTTMMHYNILCISASVLNE